MKKERMVLPHVEIEHLFYAEIEQGGDLLLHDSMNRELLVSPIIGGYFTGDKLSGHIAGISNSLTYTTKERRNDLEITFLLETDGGEKILAKGRGLFFADLHLEQRIEEGEAVDPSTYYFRMQLAFETGCEKYEWLNRKCCFAIVGLRGWTAVCFDAYAVN